jgi:hypothetical protein
MVEDIGTIRVYELLKKRRRLFVHNVKIFFMPMVTLLLCASWVSFCVDTGAHVNIMVEKTFLKLKMRPKLYKPSVLLNGYGKVPIRLLGEFRTRVLSNGIFKSATFRVT